MGSTSWHDNILQALLIGLVVHIAAYVLCVFWTFLWDSWKERMARPETGESMPESDVEMGTEIVGEGATIPDNPWHGLAANSGVGDDGKLDDTENLADARVTTPEIPTVDHLPEARCKNAIKDVKRRLSLCACFGACFTPAASRGAGWIGGLICKSSLQHPVCRMLDSLETLSNLQDR